MELLFGVGFRSLVFLLLFLGLVCYAIAPAVAADQLPRFLKRLQPEDVFPGADRVEAPKGSPAIASVYAGDELLGHAFLNSDIVNATGYSGKPIHVLVALDNEGVIRNAKLLDHHEPIVLVGIPEKRITDVIDGYVGLDVVSLAKGNEREEDVDIVSGATVTIMVIDDSLVRASMQVARSLGLGGLEPQTETAGPKRTLIMDPGEVESWETLLGDGTVRRLRLSVADINQAFAESGDLAAGQRPEEGPEDDAFIDLYVALVSVPSIGLSLLGEREFGNLQKRLKSGEHAILLAAEGRYSFKGSGYVRGGIFDRFHMIQGDNSLRFRDRQHKRLREIAADGAPKLKEVDLFVIPANSGFDPTANWQIELLVSRATGATSKAFLTFDLGYQVPDRFVKTEAPPPSEPVATTSADTASPERAALWQRLWKEKIWEIAVLVVAIGVVTSIFIFQNWLAKRPRLTDMVRVGFLIFTVVGIGFYANAQLSVVNVLTFFNALITSFSWDYFLMEPLIFILWSATAVGVLFWGRGPFCGWLCPFGALQELVNRLAKLVRIPQVKVPWWLHERMWPLKYMIFLVLFGYSLYSLSGAEHLAEIEPFKTAIILKFVREWPYVTFAVALLVAGLFIERFYCRYLCPLGAALAIPGRMRMFEWLRRYKECGSPCKRCANECMVEAIHPEGHINPNECLYCLNCQVLYHHDHKCPVMIQRRLKQERRQALASTHLPGSPRPAETKKELSDFMPG